MKQIKTLQGLMDAANKRKAVTCPSTVFCKRVPASFVISMQGREILRLINYGLYIYERKSK